MKKLLAILLATALLSVGCALADGDSAPDWSAYDPLIDRIQQEPKPVIRERMLHRAEDMLMDTGAITPLWYLKEYWLQRDGLDGVYADPYGRLYFQRVAGSDGALRLDLTHAPESLDPAMASQPEEIWLALAAFGGLYGWSADGALVPNLAADCEVSEDGLTCAFTLREGLKWSDGAALDAHDFEYSWKRAADPATGSPFGRRFDVIKGYPSDLAVSASEDGRTLTVELNAPCAFLTELTATPAFFAVPRAAAEAGEWGREAGFACSGPFALTGWSDGTLSYAKNSDYWDADGTIPEGLSVTFTGDDALAAFQSDSLDIITHVPLNDIANLRETDQWHELQTQSTACLSFNVHAAMFEGKTTRQAIAMRKAIAQLVSRDFIIDDVTQIEERLADTLIGWMVSDGHGGTYKLSDDEYSYPVDSYLDDDTATSGYIDVGVSADIDAAIELLTEAGFKFEDDMLSAATPIALEYLTDNSPVGLTIAEYIQQGLAEIGIEVTIRACDWSTFVSERKAGHYDLTFSAMWCDFDDPVSVLGLCTADSLSAVCTLGK